MRKNIFIFLLVGVLALFFSGDAVFAARLLPRFRQTGVKTTAGSGVGTSVRLRSDRKALLVYFSNLSKAKSVSYVLMYETNGKEEGVGGSIDSTAGNSAQRVIDFGTCSSGVCRDHSNITKMTFEVTVDLPSGKKTLRKFRIRV